MATMKHEDIKVSRVVWAAVAAGILGGEFDNAHSSTVKSLSIGLRLFNDDPTCKKALDHLSNLKARS